MPPNPQIRENERQLCGLRRVYWFYSCAVPAVRADDDLLQAGSGDGSCGEGGRAFYRGRHPESVLYEQTHAGMFKGNSRQKSDSY